MTSVCSYNNRITSYHFGDMFIWVRNDTENHKTSENKMAATALILKVFTLFNTIYQLHAVHFIDVVWKKKHWNRNYFYAKLDKK